MNNSNQQNHEYYPEEIDLVDVAAVVYRRKATMVLVVLFSVIVALGYWFSSDEKIKVSAVFIIGEKAMLESSVPVLSPLMSALDTSELLNLIYIPQSIKSNTLETGTHIDKEAIDIKHVSKKNFKESTVILSLFAKASQKKSQDLVSIINGSLELLEKNHAEKLDEYKNRVRYIIETKKSNLQLLNQNHDIAGSSDGMTLEASVFITRNCVSRIN